MSKDEVQQSAFFNKLKGICHAKHVISGFKSLRSVTIDIDFEQRKMSVEDR